MDVQKFLAWREGDEITQEHRNALASDIARTFNLSPEKEAETQKKYAHIPESAIADGLAVTIATMTKMDVDTFKNTFPTIARDSRSLAVQTFLTHANKIQKQDTRPENLSGITYEDKKINLQAGTQRINLQAGEVVLRANMPVEAHVKFWDESKTPHNTADVTVYLDTEETNIFTLKTMALMKAQELIVHIASIALGRGEELLNDFIIDYEKLKSFPPEST